MTATYPILMMGGQWRAISMLAMLGFELDFWDYATFAAIFVSVVCLIVSLLWVAGLPGRIAIARKHPDAEAVMLMGYAGFLPLVPWIQAFIWAFKPTEIVDIRRFPAEEAKGVDEEIARLRGDAEHNKTKTASPDISPDARE
jgi:hypothetical protein